MKDSVPMRALQKSISLKEGSTALLDGRTLPAGALCGRVFKAQFAAKNGAGESAVYTTTATYTMPACPKGGKRAPATYPALGPIGPGQEELQGLPACLCLLAPALKALGHDPSDRTPVLLCPGLPRSGAS